MDMLKQDPDERPSANEIMYTRLPEVCQRFHLLYFVQQIFIHFHTMAEERMYRSGFAA